MKQIIKYLLYGVAILTFYLLLSLLLKGGKYDNDDTIMGFFSNKDILIGCVISAMLTTQRIIKSRKNTP